MIRASPALIGALTLLQSCAEAPDVHQVRIGGASYEFPEQHVRSVVTEPHQFVRVSDPATGYELVHDSRIARQKHPGGLPVVFSVTDGARGTARNVRFIPSDAGQVVCRAAPDPYGGCGLRIDHGGIAWSLLFPKAMLPEARELREQAEQELAIRRRS